MPSLRQLHARCPRLLILDAASLVVQVGWLEIGRTPAWVALEEEAGSGLFRALDELGKRPRDADAFGFCEGPGSILGIRSAAVALTTWQALRERPSFAYRSLVARRHNRTTRGNAHRRRPPSNLARAHARRVGTPR